MHASPACFHWAMLSWRLFVQKSKIWWCKEIMKFSFFTTRCQHFEGKVLNLYWFRQKLLLLLIQVFWDINFSFFFSSYLSWVSAKLKTEYRFKNFSKYYVYGRNIYSVASFPFLGFFTHSSEGNAYFQFLGADVSQKFFSFAILYQSGET